MELQDKGFRWRGPGDGRMVTGERKKGGMQAAVCGLMLLVMVAGAAPGVQENPTTDDGGLRVQESLVTAGNTTTQEAVRSIAGPLHIVSQDVAMKVRTLLKQ